MRKMALINVQIFDRKLFDCHCSAAGADHQHGTAADGLIIEIDADDGVCSHGTSLLLHLIQRNILCFAQFLLVRCGPSADDIADAGKEILEDIRSEDRFAADEAVILLYFFPFDRVRCGN